MAKRGRPKKYKKAEQLQKKIDEYFADCDEREAPYTVTGLALACDLTREGLLNYEHDDDFSDTVKRAKQRVLKHLEERLYNKSTFTPGIIFGLKNNYQWRDTQHLAGDENAPIVVKPVWPWENDDEEPLEEA